MPFCNHCVFGRVSADPRVKEIICEDSSRWKVTILTNGLHRESLTRPLWKRKVSLVSLFCSPQAPHGDRPRVLANPAVTAAVMGASSVAQLEANKGAYDAEITLDDRDALNQVIAGEEERARAFSPGYRVANEPSPPRTGRA